MRRYLILLGVLILAASSIAGLYFFNNYWIHRYDELIAQQAVVYHLDKDLVWSLIYQETYFRPSVHGTAGEVGLMQVTPAVAREWARETGFREFEKQTSENFDSFLSDPERNIQIGCWYLEKLREPYRGFSAEEAMTLAAYNAGASRVQDWSKFVTPASLTENEFIERIDIPSTRAYVSSILDRYHAKKERENDGQGNSNQNAK